MGLARVDHGDDINLDEKRGVHERLDTDPGRCWRIASKELRDGHRSLYGDLTVEANDKDPEHRHVRWSGTSGCEGQTEVVQRR